MRIIPAPPGGTISRKPPFVHRDARGFYAVAAQGGIENIFANLATKQWEDKLINNRNARSARFVVKGNLQDWDQFTAKAKTCKVDRLIELCNQVYKRSK